MGFEGANVIFDSWVHPLMMGLEEHLLAMFRDDFEFNDAVAPSHLHAHTPADAKPDVVVASIPTAPDPRDVHPGPQANALVWALDAEKELKRIPFFVRGKARRNTETFAREQGIDLITLETLYDAKAHFGR